MWKDGWNPNQKGKAIAGKQWQQQEIDHHHAVTLTAAEKRKAWWAKNGNWVMEKKAESTTGMPGLDWAQSKNKKNKKNKAANQGGAWQQDSRGIWVWVEGATGTSSSSQGPGTHDGPADWPPEHEPPAKKQKQAIQHHN